VIEAVLLAVNSGKLSERQAPGWRTAMRVASVVHERELIMNKNKKHTSSGNLSFKRETIRTLTANEIRTAAGGRMCLPDSCKAPTCPGSVCTITVDETM
jgi:hypothetical protein